MSQPEQEVEAYPSEGEEEDESSATIQEITNILAQFEEEDVEGDNSEEEDTNVDIDVDINNVADVPEMEVILPPRVEEGDGGGDPYPYLNPDWTEDFEWEDDEEYEAEGQFDAYPSTDLNQLLQEINEFEEKLDKQDPDNYAEEFDYGEAAFDYGGYDHYNNGGEGDPWPLTYDYEEEVEGEEYGEYVDVAVDIDTTTDQYFQETIMTIPEQEGIEALDQAALIADVKDLLASFRAEEEVLRKDYSPGEEYESPATPVLYRCPSIESFFRQGHGHEATVAMYLVPGRKMISKEVRLDTTIYQLKASISRYTHVGPELLDLRLRQILVINSKTLTDLGVRAGQRVRFTVELNQMAIMSEMILTGRTSADYHHGVARLGVPDLDSFWEEEREDTVRFVNITPDPAPPDGATAPDAQLIAPYQKKVIIVHPTEKKRMLGGFQDKITTLVYHDAATMTSDTLAEETGERAPPTEEEIREKCHKDKVELAEHGLRRTKRCGDGLDKAVQVFHESEFGTQTTASTATQMTRTFGGTNGEAYYASEQNDVILTPKPYRTWDEVMAEQAAAVTKIARKWRTIAARRARKRRFEMLIRRVAFAEKIRKGRMDERKKIMEEEFIRQKNPTRLLDLELLYREINRWRGEQEAYIMANRWGAERKAAFATLAEMEADLLLELDRTKRRIIANRKDNFMHGQFKQMGLPKRWFNPKAAVFLSLDNAGRQNCRKLHDIYKALLEPVHHSVEGHRNRLELIKGVHQLLITQMEGVARGAMPMADMLTELFSREIKFMNIAGVGKLLSGIRKRVASTFYYLCMDPAFNEEAQRIDKVQKFRNSRMTYYTQIPHNLEKLTKDMVQCRGCRRMMYKDDFTIEKGTHLTERCRNCTRLYRTSILRLDLNIYRQMLDELRQDEFKAGVPNSMAYLIDAFDMRVIIEQIWHAQSILSGNTDRYMLRLCRFRKQEAWTPWNCILLAEDEAVAHLYLEDMTLAYQPTLFHRVRVKHATAKVYFHGLANLSLGLDERVLETCKIMKETERRAHAGMRKWRKKVQVVNIFKRDSAKEEKKDSAVSAISAMSFGSMVSIF